MESKSRARVLKAAIILLFTAALIFTAAACVKRYGREMALAGEDTLQAAGAMADAALFIPVLAGELFACKSLLYLLAGENRSRRRNALNAVILAFSAIMAALPILALTGHRLIPSGAASNGSGSLLLAIQLGLPFALMLVSLLLTIADIARPKH